MKQPLDPNNLDNPDGGEYSWGRGLFPPGVANNEGQRRSQDDFGNHMVPSAAADGTSHQDNYARQVADRRTDTTDPGSGRDMESLGNTDRYGAAPPLVEAARKRDVSQHTTPPQSKMIRKR